MKILLVCNAGMSTGILKVKLQESASKMGIETEIKAVPITQLDEYSEGVTALLLGPQIGFAKEELKEEFGSSIPILVISPMDFGLMNADKILSDLMEVINK